MITISINEEQIKRAEKLYPFKELDGSITGGKSNIYGALGEIIVYDYFSDKAEFKSTYDYDLIIDGYKVDVKTKRSTTTPKPYYLCSIFNYNTKQKCDYYFFTRVKEDLSEGYLLGYIDKKSFYKKAIYNKKGETDGDYFVFKDNCYNLSIDKLKKFKEDKNVRKTSTSNWSENNGR